MTPDNRVRVLQNAAQTYPALEDALRAARHSIHLEYYSWASDSVGEALREILAAKVAEGSRSVCSTMRSAPSGC